MKNRPKKEGAYIKREINTDRLQKSVVLYKDYSDDIVDS